MKTWLITGCSTGFGRVLAAAVAARGDRLVATARDPETLAGLASRYVDTVRTAKLDVTQPGDALAAIEVARTAFGGLDVLVNNAGFGFIGAVEEGAPDEYRPMFETNVFGLIETTRAALPALRERAAKTGAGRIVNFSSGAGIAGGAGSGLYCATKFAVEGVSEALAQEVEPLGIRVVIVEPVRSAPTSSAVRSRPPRTRSRPTARRPASGAITATPTTASKRATPTKASP